MAHFNCKKSGHLEQTGIDFWYRMVQAGKAPASVFLTLLIEIKCK
jgi:hypothetical protein